MPKFLKILPFTILCFLLSVLLSAQKSNMAFRHLTTDDGLSQNGITGILKDRRGFMWFATHDGLNRYDGNTFVVYKNTPNDSQSLSANFIHYLLEDGQGFLWIGTYSGGVSKFDPITERFTRYRHNPDNPNSLSDDLVRCIAKDRRGYLWFGTANSGLDKFDQTTETFTHYRDDSEGQFVGEINSILEDSQGDIWFVSTNGLYHVNPQTGQITRPPATIAHNLAADYVSEDKDGNLWMLAWTPVVGLIKYDRRTELLTDYPVDSAAVGIDKANLLDDGQNGFWVPSSLGLYHFDRQTGRFTYRFQHDETNPASLNDDRVVSVYQDRSGLLWVGLESRGLNLLNFQQQQFGAYQHDPADPNSLSSGRVTGIYQDPSGIVWIGFTPRALDRLDRKTGKITHYVTDLENDNTLGKGLDVNSIYKDSQGYIWLGGWDGGLVRLNERSGQFKHFRHNPDEPTSLISNDVLYVYEDQSGCLWVGQSGGLSRFDRTTEKFTNYRHNPDDPTSLGQTNVNIICQDRSGVLWLGTWGGVLSRFDDNTKTFRNYTPDSRNPHRLNGGSIYAIHEDRTGTLWLGASDGLYRFNRANEMFTRYTEDQGLPSSSIMGILEDNAGRLWLSTRKGLSCFEPQTERCRNYDASDGIQVDNSGQICYKQGKSGEMFFGGSKGFHAFFPDSIRDNPYVPPIVLTDFRLFGKSVPIGRGSVLKKTINETDSLTLPYKLNSLSFEFAALSYAAPEKNRYRYMLEGFDADWHDAGSKERLAVYTNLGAGDYIFRVQGTNQDGVWNKKGKAIYVKILTPWWQTWLFRSIVIVLIVFLIFVGFRLRIRNIKKQSQEFERLVVDRTAQLETVNKELEAFAYSVSHDLRAPLRGIDGFSQILLEEYQDKVDEQGKSYLQRIRYAAQRMAQLIDDMLNLSRVSRGEMSTQQVDLSEIVKNIADNLIGNQPERKVKFVIQEGIIVRGDSRLLRIVLENLIGNAWKFTSKHSTACIEFGMQLQKEIQVYFVRDDGAGFDMNYAQKLFGAFQRLHTTTEFPGTGIGLATVQRVIHRHGGKVWAEGEVEKGATFYFTIS